MHGALQDRNTIAQLATFWGCSYRTVKRRIASGALACIRDGRIVRITREQVLEYEAQRNSGGAPAVPGPPRMARRVRDSFETGRAIAGKLKLAGLRP